MILNLFHLIYERLLAQEILNGPVPPHIAIIMDGNRRFAKQINEQNIVGHNKGAETIEKLLDWAHEIRIKQVTLYAFSTENFNRTAQEVEQLFELMKDKFEELLLNKKIYKNKVKVRAVGDINRVPEFLKESIKNAEYATQSHDELLLNIAIAYGGREDIIQSVKEITDKVVRNELDFDDITEDTISNHLYPIKGASIPAVDLIIRTGGDRRMSNFLPWQANGSECAAYFCTSFWPNLRKIDFLRSIRVYQTRIENKKPNTANRIMRFLYST
ncbi:MAG: di-trans,poly-cis-decaprenylcistransferase [Methanosarcinales archaeon]|nr:di-trans,poly-cis-decaprenylcistransferase [Methanosarcinales archaeon]